MIHLIKNRHRNAAYNSHIQIGRSYVFSRKEGARYRCTGCEKAFKTGNRERSVPTVKVIGDNFESDPDLLAHFCQPVPTEKTVVKNIIKLVFYN